VKRRLATLATLARLDDRRMREAAAELVPLLDRAARLASEAQELERRRKLESAVTELAAMPYLGHFLATHRREMDRIRADSAATEEAVEAKRDEVLEAWKDLRPKERLQASLRGGALQKRLQADQEDSDAEGGQAHARRLLSQRRAARD
jgi:hypothetical protein